MDAARVLFRIILDLICYQMILTAAFLQEDGMPFAYTPSASKYIYRHQ
jgi:hypothetical protein